jgi:hypothetical protein
VRSGDHETILTGLGSLYLYRMRALLPAASLQAPVAAA